MNCDYKFIGHIKMIKPKFKKGFTLADVLIALLLVGVLSALCIPLMHYEKISMKNKILWRSTYKLLENTVKKVAWDHNGSIAGIASSSSDHNSIRNAFLPFLKDLKSCDAGTADCWHKANEWKLLSGVNVNDNWSAFSKLILSNRTHLVFTNIDQNCQGTESPDNDTCFKIQADINGLKGPNQVGQDIFAMLVLENGKTLPVGSPGDSESTDNATKGCDGTTPGWCCSNDYLYDDPLD